MKYTLTFESPLNIATTDDAVRYLSTHKRMAKPTLEKKFCQEQWEQACSAFLARYNSRYPYDYFEVHTTTDPDGIKLTTVRWGGKYGQAACNPEDKYNAAIGKAIALCRAHYGQDCDYQSIIGLE